MTDHGQQHEGETLRAAQETAVRDVLERLTTIPGLQRQVLAGEVVDAVLAAGQSDAGLTAAERQTLADAVTEAGRVHFAAGYATAVANCRDDAGYDAWVRHQPDTQPRRWTRADYLEAVGPTAAGEVHRVERRPDGVIAEEHTFTRKHLNELVEGTRAIGPGADETRCTCPRVDVSTFLDDPRNPPIVKGLDPNCPTCGGGRG